MAYFLSTVTAIQRRVILKSKAQFCFGGGGVFSFHRHTVPKFCMQY